MSDLAAFQDTLVRALRGQGDLSAHGPNAAIALRVYRNTVSKGVLDALRGNFPSVERLVGEDWFADCARLYAAATPAAEPSLLTYGESFPAFLSGFDAAADLPYLPGVATLDRLWTEAHLAADAQALTPDAAAAIPPQDLFATRLDLHPSARIAWFDVPAPSIWRMNRPPAPVETADEEIAWTGEGLLLVRPEGEVVTRLLDAPAFTFLASCREGRTLGEAASAALEADSGFDLARLFADLLTLGAFAAPAHDLPTKDPQP